MDFRFSDGTLVRIEQEIDGMNHKGSWIKAVALVAEIASEVAARHVEPEQDQHGEL